MSAYKSARSIELEDAAVYCEGESCGRRISCLGDLAGTFTIKRSGRESGRAFHSISSDGLFAVEGVVGDERAARMVAKEAGWIVETVHGKEMDFCPNCKAK